MTNQARKTVKPGRPAKGGAPAKPKKAAAARTTKKTAPAAKSAKTAKASVRRPAPPARRPAAPPRKAAPAVKTRPPQPPPRAAKRTAASPAATPKASSTTTGGKVGLRQLIDAIPEFRGAKRKRYETLIQLRDEMMSQFRDLSDASLSYQKEAGEDLADIGSENFARDLSLALMSAEGSKISLIQDAIYRLIEGSYGTCIDCGGHISEARLDAIPYAKLCVNCKEAREKEEEIPAEEEVEEEVVE
ncbi:MAG: RNA polymerase-binding transcription factor [Lentisphaerae bacterium ADurb.BinA184]|nr:MAG: RNA polymerase-binding transcription factor [Lentisphaerae bacterium ADurb.BinA184]